MTSTARGSVHRERVSLGEAGQAAPPEARVLVVALSWVVDRDEVEHVYATVVPQRGKAIDPAELRLHVEGKLSATHAPAHIDVRDAPPRPSTRSCPRRAARGARAQGTP
jgi:hypothetical protein